MSDVDVRGLASTKVIQKYDGVAFIIYWNPWIVEMIGGSKWMK